MNIERPTGRPDILGETGGQTDKSDVARLEYENNEPGQYGDRTHDIRVISTAL